MEDFKQHLSDDAPADDRRALEQIEAGLAGLRLEKKVAEAARARAQFSRQRIWRGVMLGLLIAALWALIWLVWDGQKRATPPVNLPSKSEPQRIENQQVEPQNLPSENAAPALQKPIAERPKTSRERTGQPLVRSAKPDLDAATNQLLDQLLTQTGTANTSPMWQAAVRDLAANQPAKAKQHIFDLEKTDAAEAQWLLAIALLEEGKSDEAEVIFQKIARQNGHPRQILAQKALEKLGQ